MFHSLTHILSVKIFQSLNLTLIFYNFQIISFSLSHYSLTPTILSSHFPSFSLLNSFIHTLSVKFSLNLSLKLTDLYSLTHFLTNFPLSLTHSQPFSPSLTLKLTQTLSHTLSLKHSLTYHYPLSLFHNHSGS